MTGRDLYTQMSYINDKFIQEAEATPQKTRTSLRRTTLVAAMLVLLLTLVGYAAVPAILDAEEPWISIPQVAGADVPRNDIQIRISDVTPGELTFTCKLAGFGEAEKSVVLYTDPACTIERKTDSGWEAVTQKTADPQWDAEAVLTDGHFDGRIRWAAHYGLLDAGTYRVSAQLIEGHEAFTLEFDITEEMYTNPLERADALLNRNAWHIRQIPDNSSYMIEYWKCENDYLMLIYDGDRTVSGMMLKDGVKYRLAREAESNDSPIVGWASWPEMDLNRLTQWAQLFEDEQLRLEIAPGKNNVAEIWKLWLSGSDSYRLDEGVTSLGTLEILDTSPEEICQMIRQQDTHGPANP